MHTFFKPIQSSLLMMIFSTPLVAFAPNDQPKNTNGAIATSHASHANNSIHAIHAVHAQDPQPSDEHPAGTQLDPLPAMEITRNIRYIDRPGWLDHFTSLDVYEPSINRSANEPDPLRPILIFIHGGGWALGDKSGVYVKPEWALRNNWVFVSVNYRLSPSVMHPEHARDVSASIAYIRKHASDFHADPDRIVIMGHSAGAHLAAIVATDQTLLGEHKLAPSDLAGVVLLDGAGYNIPQQMNLPMPNPKTLAVFEAAFGTKPTLWVQASPTLQAEPDEDLAPLLAIHVPRTIARIQTVELVKAWNATMAEATRHFAPDDDHASINQDMGIKNDPQTRVVESFIRSVFDQD